MSPLQHVKPWLVMILVISIGSFTLLAMTSDGDDGWWLVAGAIFHGLLIALVVWREGHTPSSAWAALRRPPREDL